MMVTTQRIVLGLGVLAVGAFTVLTDPFLLKVACMGLCFFVLLPVALSVGCIWIFGKRSEQAVGASIFLAQGIVWGLLGMCLAVPANAMIYQQATKAGKNYLHRMQPLLETYRNTHGAYPSSLDQLQEKPQRPRLVTLLNHYKYQSDGTRYSLTFAKPGGLIDAWSYDSQTRSWTVQD